MQDSNESADTKSARHGRFRAKEKTPTTELNNFFSKIFSLENNNL